MLPDEVQTTTGTFGSDIFAILNARIDDETFQKERRERITMIEAARAYFDGEHPKPLKVPTGEKDPNVIINLCRSLINKSVSWLFGDPENGEMITMELPVEDEDKQEAAEPGAANDGGEGGEIPPQQDEPHGIIAEAEAWVKSVWEANGGAQFLNRVGRRTSIAGHGFIKVLPVGDEGNPLEVPRLVLQKPEMVSVLTRQDDTDTAEAFVIEWVEKRRINTRLRDVRVRQIVVTVEGVWVIARFNDLGRGKNKWLVEMGPEVWPYTWCPIVDWQNLPDDKYYGLSDLEDLPTINDAVNFSISNTNRILYVHGHPRTIGLGFEASEVQEASIDSFWTVAKSKNEADIRNLEMQSDLASAFAFVQFMVQSFWDIGRDLDLGSLRDRIGQVTNFGLRVLANNALSKLGDKRLSYGDAINRINRIVLELGGFPVQDTVIHWRNPLPEDDTEEAERLAKEREMGIVSKQTASEERGREWETEQERIQQEEAALGNVGAALLQAFERGGPVNPLRRGQPVVPQRDEQGGQT